MPSITSWTRIEPHCRSEEMRNSLQAQIHDPLWLLARQWQVGEFKGEDGGSPVSARVRGVCSLITRYHPGQLTQDNISESQVYDGYKIPLETIVEREDIRGGSSRSDDDVNQPRNSERHLAFAAEAGLNFLRLLTKVGVGAYRDAFINSYSLKSPVNEKRHTLDSKSLRFLDVMADRVPDGDLLYNTLNEKLTSSEGALNELLKQLGIHEENIEKVRDAVLSWIRWYDQFLSEPPAIPPTNKSNTSSWIPERMEYKFAVSAKKDNEEIALVAAEYVEGHLDWYSFNVQPGVSLGANSSNVPITQTIIPAPVSYRGMPAARLWEFEDSQVDFGSLDTGPEDLARLLLTEFALLYGNDWFTIPVELDVGSICNIRSLVVTDTFGERTLIRHFSQSNPASLWRMFYISLDGQASTADDNNKVSEFLFLPPVLAASLQSPPIEEVLLIRDEMANMAWAVERIVEGYTGRPIKRFEDLEEKRQLKDFDVNTSSAGGEPINPDNSIIHRAPIAYRLASMIPDYWIPLLPVKINEGAYAIKLRRGGMPEIQRDGSWKGILVEPQGRMLEPDRDLNIYEEEVPRAGARITRGYQYSRWINGSTHLWIGRRKQPGRGEGSSGLRFDLVEQI